MVAYKYRYIIQYEILTKAFKLGMNIDRASVWNGPSNFHSGWYLKISDFKRIF